MARLAPALLIGLLLGGCSGDVPDSSKAETTYGAPVDATTAVPAPAVAAEERLYVDRALAIDGRIKAVRADGCTMVLATVAAPLVVTAPRPSGGAARTDDGSCVWQVPNDAQGFAVAAGTLRAAGDTLRLPANGVRVTPVRLSSPDS
jgi:hypothetical protein